VKFYDERTCSCEIGACIIKAIVAHEPPVLRVLPDSKKWLRFFSGVYRTGFRFGHQVAMLKFARSVSIPLRTYAKIPKDLGNRMDKNLNFFVNHEMLLDGFDITVDEWKNFLYIIR
jgi:hypothetical protein